MGEPPNQPRTPLTPRVAVGFTVTGFILLPFAVVPIALADFHGVSIKELAPSLIIFPEAVFRYLLLVAILGFAGGLILGLAGLKPSIDARSRSGKFWSVLSIVGFIFLLMVIKATSNFTRYRARIKQQEAKEWLYKLYEAEQDYFKQKGVYAKTFRDLKLQPTNNQRYAFFLSPSESIQPNGIEKPYSLPEKYRAIVNSNSFQIIAVGNINRNPAQDVWQINDKRQLANLFDDIKGVEPKSMYP